MRTGIQTRSAAGLVIAVTVFSSQLVHAQKSPPPASGGNPLGAGRMPPPNAQPGGPAMSTLNGNIYLSGNVVLDDGNPPPDSVTIERICNGSPRAQGYTDRKGRFSFQVGQASTVMQDASEDGSSMTGPSSHMATGINSGVGPQQPQMPNAPDMQLANCDLRAVLSGFRSDTITLGARRLMDDPNVGTIVLHRLADVQGSAISVTSLRAPKEARQAYDKAAQHVRKNKLSEAARELHKAVEIYPDYAAAWYELGRIQKQNQETQEARNSFGRAMEADAKFVSPYAELAELEALAENWTALAGVTGKLIKLDAVDYPMAYFYSAMANLNLGRLDEAEKTARDGIKLDAPHRFPRLEEVLAMILERKQDHAGAAAHLRLYLELSPDAPDAARMQKQLAQLESLSGVRNEAKAAADHP